MPYLIDGHNLISYLPDIDLADPHDEAKLVLKLRGFCARTGKKVTVIFDKGLPGGTSALTTHSVKVIFASSERQNADTLIRDRVFSTPDARNWTLVSSDNEVLDSARQQGMKGMKCLDFAELLTRQRDSRPHRGINPNVYVPQSEVAEWLEIFGEEAPIEVEATDPAPRLRPRPDESPEQKPRRRKPKAPKKKKQDTLPQVNASNATADDVQITNDSVDEWLEIFGNEGEAKPTEPRPNKRASRRRKPNRNQSVSKQQAAKPDPEEAPLHDVGAWLEIFGGDDADTEPTDYRPQRSDPGKQGRFGKNRREPTVHKNMATSDELYLSSGEVEAWMEFFGAEDEDDEE